MKQLGGRETSAVGFAMGIERLISLLEEIDLTERLPVPDVYLVTLGEEPERVGLKLAEQLRDALPELRLINHCGGGGFKIILRNCKIHAESIIIKKIEPKGKKKK